MKIDRIDHLVLTVADLDATLAFYRKVLGMEQITFDGGRHALRFGNQKINLHVEGAEIKPNAQTAVPGAADLCFIAATPFADVCAHIVACGVAVVHGPVAQNGALGTMDSIYIRDPDGNLVEIAVYR